jgi:hypothetical protein
MSLAVINKFEQAFDRIVPTALLVGGLALLAAVASVGV